MSVDPSKLGIVHFPAEVLRRKAKPVVAVDDLVVAVARRMIELMHEAEGVGLAAPQVGLPWRMFVANSREPGDEDRVYINPRLTFDGEMVAHDEGCLSLPGIRADIRRPSHVTIVALDAQGREFTLTSGSFPARIWQHENDHLDGVLILDRMTTIDRIATRRAVKDLLAAAES